MLSYIKAENRSGDVLHFLRLSVLVNGVARQIDSIVPEYTCTASIQLHMEMTEGDLPRKAQELVKEWMRKNQDELLKMWESQNLKRLPPLQ